MHRELMLSPSPSTSGTTEQGAEVNDRDRDTVKNYTGPERQKDWNTLSDYGQQLIYMGEGLLASTSLTIFSDGNGIF